MKQFRALLALTASLLLVSCGGGSSSSPPSPSAPSSSASGFTQQYTASATAGEVLTYTIDTNALTYSYKIVYSAYGLTNTTGTGTLKQNADGSYTPSEAPNSKVYALQNGLLIGAVNLSLGGIPRIVPILGISNPISTASSLAGTYNYISLQCAHQSFGVYTGCHTSFGTVQVDNASSYTICDQANITNGTSGCNAPSTGTFNLLGNGVWSATRTGSINTNHFLAYTAPDGQTVGILDLNDPGGYGYGMVVMSSQAGYNQSVADGTYLSQATNGIAASLDISGTTIKDSLGNSFTATFNAPWIGMASISGGGYALLAGAGAYAYGDPSNFLELGMKE